jgi:hypothetical protein
MSAALSKATWCLYEGFGMVAIQRYRTKVKDTGLGRSQFSESTSATNVRLRMYNGNVSACAFTLSLHRQRRTCRMPLLRYFMVVGSVLVGLLFWVSNESEPNSSPIKTSQVVGVPRPFKATRPELMPDLTALNFARAKVDPAARAARAEAPPTKKRVTSTQPPVEYRQNNASVAISRPPRSRFGLMKQLRSSQS